MSDPKSSTYNVGTAPYPIDCYGTPTAGQRPVVVILHGVDGLVGESATEVGKLATQIAGDGYLVFVPTYLEEIPGVTGMPPKEELLRRTDQVNTYRPRVSAAVDYALAHPNADRSRFGIVGLSLGGGLAVWYAQSVAPGAVKAVVDFFGFISDPAIYVNVSKLPPTLVFHHADDGLVSRTYSDKLIERLKEQHVVHDSEIYGKPAYPERWNHTFRPGGHADVDSRDRTRKWLDTYVKP